ncbi:hypothetical protein AB4874_13865 [Thioclava sp. 15-R06ZXC-3]|uniref:Outer membrane protein beta-barrel domain-containing protein n=1 Tax=Thioclava arctica TaxID=3238301 RepID=A0ABV3TN79_9RHOB
MFTKFVPLVFVLASATASFAGELAPPTTTTTSVKNDPSLFLGLSWTFGGTGIGGGTPGVSLKLLSTNKRDAPAASAGVTYNLDGTFGCDLGIGYNTSDASMTFGYDFCKRGVQFGVGGTKKPDTVTTTSVTPG